MAKIDILVPTFNRAHELRKNLSLIADQIEKNGLREEINVLVSDNSSMDETGEVLSDFKRDSRFVLRVFRQDANIGLEKNAIFLLGVSVTDFVMFLGDDDYLPDDYLEFLFWSIANVESLSAVVPGFSSLQADGSLVLGRTGKIGVSHHTPSFYSSLKLSRYGHQLSGLLLLREGLFDVYCKHEEFRNIYPFIAFLSMNCVRGTVIYAPKFQVSITVFNCKDWKYDDSGLLTEIFKNYYLVFGRNSVRALLSCTVFIFQQPWRLRLSSPKNAWRSFLHLQKSKDTRLILKIVLPVVYMFGVLKSAGRVGVRLVTEGRLRSHGPR